MLRDTEAMAAYSPSMLLDYRAGRPLEIEAIYGNPLRAAEEAGADCPLIRDAYQGLQAVAPHARSGQQ
jgi:2-dehydropantoate 2-reductase